MMSAIGRIFGFVGRAIVILLVIGFVALLLEDDKPSKHLNHASSSNGAKVTDYATRIRPYAYQPYTADQYPKTFAEFGQRLSICVDHALIEVPPWISLRFTQCFENGFGILASY